MPLYEYRCATCGHRFEQLVRTEADVPHKCPKCGAREVEKQFSAFAASVHEGSTASPSCPTGTCPFAG